MITLTPSYDFENWRSMQVYRDLVYEGLMQDSNWNDKVNLLPLKKYSNNANKITRFYAKYIEATQKVKDASKTSELIHHLDHGYAHLIPHSKKSIVTVHDLTHYAAPELKGGQLKRWQKKMLNLKLADHILAVSQNVADLLIKHLDIKASNITVAYHEVNLELFLKINKGEARKSYRKSLGNEFLVCSVGTIDPKKNLGVTLKAIKELRAKGHPIKLIRVGTPLKYASDEWAKLAQDLYLDDAIIELGYLPHQEVAKVMAACDAFSFPSKYEGFGMPIMEAQALEIPLICARSSCLPEIAGNGALFHHHGDFITLQKHILSVMNNRSGINDQLKESGIKNIARFSPQSHLKIIKSVYNHYGS